MTRIIEFKIPLRRGRRGKITTGEAKGVPLLLVVGEREIKFVLQYDSDNKARWLTHLASGYKVGSLDDAATELACRLSPYHHFSKRQLATYIIEKAVLKMGIDKVLATIDGAPVIN